MGSVMMMLVVCMCGRVGRGVAEGEAAGVDGEVNEKNADGAVFEQPQWKLRSNKRAQIMDFECAAV